MSSFNINTRLIFPILKTCGFCEPSYTPVGGKNWIILLCKALGFQQDKIDFMFQHWSSKQILYGARFRQQAFQNNKVCYHYTHLIYIFS